MRRELIAAWALALALPAGCVRHAAPASGSIPIEDAENDDALAPVEPPPAPEPAAIGGGPIARAELTEVLDAGPGRFLAGIEVEPVFVERRFDGWRLLVFSPRDPRIGAAPLGPGDVIRRVNDKPIGRPEQLQTVWDELRTADELVIEGLRAGAPFELRYVISSAP